ncbi:MULTISPECIES: hypothetical protein [Nocardia]|uniref:hypothetical protein n=1 Tax=Nocardia TaxID=1817 RepID=UPI001896247E|nr:MULTISPECIES: hypothetical protein [Nocardia]MBF6350479.1 hypothetical protein [Nocardia flavorosea]
MTVETIAVGHEDPHPRHGRAAGFRDHVSGYEFCATTPEHSPDLWHRYLTGAREAYRHFGNEEVLEYDTIADGSSTALFFAATDTAGAVVGGLRVQGPYTGVTEIDSLRPWAGRPGAADLNLMMARRLPRGVVESRAAWVDRRAARRNELAAAISRCIAHAPHLLGARYGFATVASFTTERHRASGGVVAQAIPSVPYPDERYRTVPIWWDTSTYPVFADRLQYLMMRGELRAMGLAEPRFSRPARPLCHGGEESRSHGR